MSYYVYITQKNGHFVAEVPALPGCRTIGRSESEVIENIRDVVRGYFQSLRKNNQAVPKVKVVKVSGFPVGSGMEKNPRALSPNRALLPSEEGSHAGPSPL